MKLLRDCLLFIALLSAPVASPAQEIAGRVLIATGDVVMVRGNERIAARAGAEIRAGDLFQIGEQSHAQLRLTDESIIALRSNTTFRLTEYVFQNRKPEEQSSFFELVKGGMRTVTGIIARLNQRGYGVTTPTATIGIRGTHYVLFQSPPAERKVSDLGVKVAALDSGTLSFAALLAQAADTPPPAGALFGSVTDGVIAVIPHETKRETRFGADQYFRLDGPAAEPQRLIAPPPELAQVARPAAKPKPAPEAAATGGESAAAVAQGAGDIRVSSSVTSTTAPPILNPTIVLPSEQATTQGVFTVVQPTGATGTVFYRLDGGVVVPAVVNGVPSFVTVDFIALGVNLGLGVARVNVGIRGDDNGAINILVPRDIPVTISGGQLSFSTSVSRSEFPFNQLAFRCQTCGPGGTVGFFDAVSVSGTISGGTATLTFSGTDQTGGSGTFTASLSERTPPNSLAAAMVVPRAGGGADAFATSTFGVQVDGAGKPVFLSNGLIRANVGTATNAIAGSDAAAGNLLWGGWTGPGAQIRDVNYSNITTSALPAANSWQPWIIGQFPNTVPTTLGSSVTYTPVGGIVNAGFGAIHSGSLNANFVNRTMSINLDVSRTSGELNRFVMSGSSTFSPISAAFGAGFSSVSCSGPCTSGGNPIGGSFSGFFSGPNAEGAGAAFTAGFGIGNGVLGVAAFRR